MGRALLFGAPALLTSAAGDPPGTAPGVARVFLANGDGLGGGVGGAFATGVAALLVWSTRSAISSAICFICSLVSALPGVMAVSSVSLARRRQSVFQNFP